METGEIQRLLYRRQYLLAPGQVDCPFEGQFQPVTSKYILYSHIDLPFCKVEKGDIALYLLGDLFDYRDPSKGNQSILLDLITCDFRQLTQNIARYSGRFVMLHVMNNHLNLIHDATAARKAYYVNHNGELWIASQPHLLARTLDIAHTADKSKVHFYNSEAFIQLHNASIGNITCYDGIFQLMPNHFLDVSTFQITRYYPDKIIEFQPVDEVVEKCSEMIRGFMESIVKRYEVMLPVTAGKDSRMLLAGSQNFKDKIFFYLNKEKGIDLKNADLKIPLRLFKRLNLRFYLTDPHIAVDRDFETIYFANNPYASKNFLPHIYNYYKNFSDRVNLPGNIASAGYELYKCKKMKISAASLAHLNNAGIYDFAVAYYENWLNDCKNLCASTNITLTHLFYWEERMGNWGNQVQMDKDMAQEDINPFNSRQLIELFLSVPGKYIERPHFELQRKIINHMWPELLKLPINPGKLKIKLTLLKLIGALDLYQRLRYELTLREKENRAMTLSSN